MKKSILAAVVMAACSVAGSVAMAMAEINVIPRPVTVEEGQGSFALKPGATVGGNDEVVNYAAEAMHLTPAKGDDAAVELSTDGADASLGEEGYELTVTDK